MGMIVPATDKKPSSGEIGTLIFAPTGRDAQLLADLLGKAGKPCRVVHSVEELGQAIREGADAALVAEEALNGRAMHVLEPVLKQQPAWSDFPVLLLVAGGRVSAESERMRLLRIPLGNVL